MAIEQGLICTSNLSLAPPKSIRELRHSPTTMPMRLTPTTLQSRWLCMPPSMHCSSSGRRGVTITNVYHYADKKRGGT